MVSANKKRDLFGGKGRYGQEEETSKAQREAYLEQLDAIEKGIDELRATYELYFMGVERIEPLRQRDRIKGQVRRAHNRPSANTRDRFRLQQLNARLVSLENYWQRTTAQREAGNYRKDKAKVARRAPVAATPQPQDHSEITDVTENSYLASRATAQDKNEARPSAARNPSELSDQQLRRLYKVYQEARLQCGETKPLRYEDMASSLRKQVPQLLSHSGAKAISFKVVIRKGKAVLKAVPKQAQ